MTAVTNTHNNVEKTNTHTAMCRDEYTQTCLENKIDTHKMSGENINTHMSREKINTHKMSREMINTHTSREKVNTHKMSREKTNTHTCLEKKIHTKCLEKWSIHTKCLAKSLYLTTVTNTVKYRKAISYPYNKYTNMSKEKYLVFESVCTIWK